MRKTECSSSRYWEIERVRGEKKIWWWLQVRAATRTLTTERESPEPWAVNVGLRLRLQLLSAWGRATE